MKSKNTSKIVSMLLAVMMLCSMAVPVFALDLDNPTGNTQIGHTAGTTLSDNGTPDDITDDTIAGTYTVSIPEYILAGEPDSTPAEYDVTASDVLIPYGTSLTVSATYDSVLLLTDNTATELPYELRANPQSAGSMAAVTSGSTILTVAAGDPDAVTTSKVAARLTQAADYAGAYTNLVGFDVSGG